MYKKLDVKDRFCKVCNTGDEQHLLVNCSAYHSLLYSFMVQKPCKNFSILSQDAKLIWLMNNESDDIFNLLSRYIYDCFKLRDDFK